MKNNKSAENAADRVRPERTFETPEEYNNELKKRMETGRNANMISLDEMKKLGFGDFAKWLRNIAKYNNTEKTMLMFKDRTKNRVFIVFYTAENRYHISAVKKDNGDSYMGCILIGRKPRPGEDWDRGSDLPDGKYTKKTWDMIVNRIIAMEMKNLQCWK